MIIGARQPITARRQTLVSDSHRSDDSVGLFGHDPTVGQSQRGTQSGYQIKSVNQAQDAEDFQQQICARYEHSKLNSAEHTCKSYGQKQYASSTLLRRLGLRDAGIDQLNFHSVQLGYLKLLQMGNADPNKTKVGNKYEVKPQYEELSKQINMNAINQCYECMRLSKEISLLGRCNNRQSNHVASIPRSINREIIGP
ncbi:hypothetical protein F511_30498 [Dorcoceras hygrometricum]|uniref:Uncharacterized protein n=1 Tax=Dorcoceras hygrometricum TaxID=472368 RepID=A0A2Z7AVK3_9LAMI|nr:hypothetical protein F511_30498 [Dorcoceras hygrometricum]